MEKVVRGWNCVGLGSRDWNRQLSRHFLEQYGNRICNRKQHRDVVTPNEQWSKLLQGVIGDYIGD